MNYSYCLSIIILICCLPATFSDVCFCKNFKKKIEPCVIKKGKFCNPGCEKVACENYKVYPTVEGNIPKVSCLINNNYYPLNIEESLCPTKKPKTCLKLHKIVSYPLQIFKLKMSVCLRGDYDFVFECNTTAEGKLNCIVPDIIKSSIKMDSDTYNFKNYNTGHVFWDDSIKKIYLESIKNKSPELSHYTIKNLALLSDSIYDGQGEIDSLLFRKTFLSNSKNSMSIVGYSTKLHSVIAVFRGTEIFSIKNWFTNMNYSRDSFENCSDCIVHRGFKNAYKGLEDQKIQEYILSLSDIFPRIIFTGHSLGGALATLALGYIETHDEVRLSLFTYGSPKVGNKKFVEFINGKASGANLRIKYRDDPISVVSVFEDFHHPGKLVCFANKNEYNVEIDTEICNFWNVLDHRKYPDIDPKKKVKVF